MFFFARKRIESSYRASKTIAVLASLSMALVVSAQAEKQKTDDTALLDSYIQSKGYNSTIVFTPSNIKQFLVEKSVLSQDETIKILLNNNLTSSPFRIQLANVNETMDCRVDIISNTADLSFSVLDNKSKDISKSADEDNFIDYNIASASFHLENTKDQTFYLQFSSKSSTELKIKKIVLSFSNNKDTSYLMSPGKIVFSESNTNGSTIEKTNDENAFIITAKKRVTLTLNKNILIQNGKVLSNSGVLKNKGTQDVIVSLGYYPYSKDGKNINNNNNPYMSNKIMKVVSAEKGSNTVIVDSEPEWAKGCRLALNAKEDLSDFPNFAFVDGAIQDVRKKDDSHYEIVFDKQYSQDIKAGTLIRVQCGPGAGGLYTFSKKISSGEEASFSRTIKVDNNCFQYNNKERDICRGTYYVVPMLLVIPDSNQQDEEYVVEISDYTVVF